MTRRNRTVIRASLALLIAGAILAWMLGWLPFDAMTIDRETIAEWVDAAGVFGPLVIIIAMILAVVASPIPSAPVALAAGAAFGHYAGATYVAIGAEIGAMTAFLIARYLGQDAVNRFLGAKADYGLLGSQNMLTLTVFASRLLPFISFDALSYAAGLSQLHLWRFLVATLAGIIPASFVLAHFGAAAISGDFGPAKWLTLGLGLATSIPILLIALSRKKKKSPKQEI